MSIKQASIRQNLSSTDRKNFDQTVESESREFRRTLHEQAKNETPMTDDIDNLTN